MYEILKAEYGPLSPEDYAEFRDWNRGNPGDVHVAYRYCMFGFPSQRNWRTMGQSEIMIYPPIDRYRLPSRI